MESPTYHEGMRELQDLRETRALADRLERVTMRAAFTDDDKAFIQRCRMFFLATADTHGQPDCSYKGGLPGFVPYSTTARSRSPTTTAMASIEAGATCG